MIVHKPSLNTRTTATISSTSRTAITRDPTRLESSGSGTGIVERRHPANAIGFERALTAGDPIMHIYFQLDADEADAGTSFNFEADFIQGEDPSSHDLEFRLNGVTFHSQAGVSTDGGAEVLVTDSFMGGDVGTMEGLKRPDNRAHRRDRRSVLSSTTSASRRMSRPDHARIRSAHSPAAPLNLAPGGSSTLRWIADPTASLSIDQGIGNVDGNTSSGIGSIAVSPTETTTYTLSSTRGGDVETAQVTITVSNIISFVADPFQAHPERQREPQLGGRPSRQRLDRPGDRQCRWRHRGRHRQHRHQSGCDHDLHPHFHTRG